MGRPILMKLAPEADLSEMLNSKAKLVLFSDFYLKSFIGGPI